METLQSALGLAAFPALAWALSENRSGPATRKLRLVAAGLAFQLAVALVLLRFAPSQGAFLVLNRLVSALEEATRAGTSFVFGYLGGGPLPFEEPLPGASFVLALQALPLILVTSALSALLWHWRILPAIVRGFSLVLERTLGVHGPLGFGAAANIFIGMVEAPLLIRPVLGRMSRSDLFTLMTCGMATVAGTVLVLYAGFLDGVIDNPLGHILTASVISAPAAILIGQLMVPPCDDDVPDEAFELPRSHDRSAMDAITRGTSEGVALLIQVTAMLLVLVALVALLNATLGLVPDVTGAPLTLQRMAGWLFAPVAWLMGIPWSETATAGSLLGTKTMLNELLAYVELGNLAEGTLSERSELILVYALCGFANFGSLGIMLGGLTAMAPERRHEIVGLGLRTIVAGTLATCMTGAVVGLIGG